MLHLSDRVKQALASGTGVVALESTIITHGMPWPENLETACAVEAAVRAQGAEPATIAIVDGVIRVGLDEPTLEALAQTQDVMKLSRADLAYAPAMGRSGSTTVAATMILAARAGIEVFATGGIGGVHRGASASFDISADLTELARTAVTVVCAGVKAILDIPATLEVLETHGVPVIACGQNEWPAFWSSSSGLAAPMRLDDAAAIVRFLQVRAALKLEGGVLIGNPVPAEHDLPPATLQPIIDQAVRECEAAGVQGKAVTPWLLSRVMELTDGRSLVTNKALIVNNARLAGQIAAAPGDRNLSV